MKFSKEKPYIIDGAMGTELQRRGFKTTLPLWSARALFDNSKLVKDIHKDYILAGSDIIITNTFRTQERTLKKKGLEKETEKINELAVDLARQAIKESEVSRKIYIAASMTTLEDCYEPELVPSNKDLKIEHKEQAEILGETDIDFFILETFNTIRETIICAEACFNTGKPQVISFIVNKDGNLLSGETLKEAIKECNKFKPLAYMVNCISIDVATIGLKKLLQLTSKSVGVCANGDGEAGSDQGWKFNSSGNLEKYMNYCKKWQKMGVNLIGGCCGTNPEYTKAYSKLKKE